MKRLFLVSLFLLVVSAPAYAQDPSMTCYSYIDTVSYNGPTFNMCWSRGAICYQCVYLDMFGGDSCAKNWSPCDPTPGPKRIPGQLALLKPKGVAIQMASLPSVRRERARTASRIRRVSKLRSVELL